MTWEAADAAFAQTRSRFGIEFVGAETKLGPREMLVAAAEARRGANQAASRAAEAATRAG